MNQQNPEPNDKGSHSPSRYLINQNDQNFNFRQRDISPLFNNSCRNENFRSAMNFDIEYSYPLTMNSQLDFSSFFFSHLDQVQESSIENLQSEISNSDQLDTYVNIYDQNQMIITKHLPDKQIEETKENSLHMSKLNLSDQKVQNFEAEDSEQIDTNQVTQTKKKYSRTYFNNIGFEFKSSKRQDIILKNILRAIRRHYLSMFNQQTRFINMKRHRGQDFYSKCLSKYVEDLFKENIHQLPTEDTGKIEEWKSQMKTLLGSIFYQKDMQVDFKNDQEMSQKIASTHNLLYYYSNSKLKQFMVDNQAIGLLLQFSFEQQEKILSYISKSKKDKLDYQTGFALLMDLHNRFTKY